MASTFTMMMVDREIGNEDVHHKITKLPQRLLHRNTCRRNEMRRTSLASQCALEHGL
jgi:hypothetical protein